MMDLKTFRDYMHLFEKEVIIKGFENGFFTKEIMVPSKNGRLDNTDYGMMIGNRIKYDKLLVVDYYGLLKKSTEFINKIKEFSEQFEIRSMKSPIVYFASIKIEQISELMKDLTGDFPEFKKVIVLNRGFGKWLFPWPLNPIGSTFKYILQNCFLSFC